MTATAGGYRKKGAGSVVWKRHRYEVWSPNRKREPRCLIGKESFRHKAERLLKAWLLEHPEEKT